MRLMNVGYEILVHQLCRIFGWEYDYDDSSYEEFSEAECGQFWLEITGSPLPPQGTSSYGLTHPCLRVANRFLSPIFGRHTDTTKINILDICLLYCMCKEGVVYPNWFLVFQTAV